MPREEQFEPERIIIESSILFITLLFAFTQLMAALVGQTLIISEMLPWMAGAGLLFVVPALVAVIHMAVMQYADPRPAVTTAFRHFMSLTCLAWNASIFSALPRSV